MVLHHASASVLPTTIPIEVEERTVEVQIDLSAGEPTIIDLRPLRQAGESLAQVTSAGEGWTLQAGQDLLVYGDFEDWDVDEDQLEVSRWDVSGTSSFPCLSQAHRGAVSLCSVRSSKNRSNSVIAFRNRIRVLGEALGMPKKDLTLVGYARGENAGEVWIEAQTYASVGSREFERMEAWRHAPGDYSWHLFSADLNLPPDKAGTDPLTANPHALRLFVFQAPPAEGDGVARLDDLAVVSWREERSLDEVVSLTAPNPVDFLRVSGPTRSSTLTLTWQRTQLTSP